MQQFSAGTDYMDTVPGQRYALTYYGASIDLTINWFDTQDNLLAPFTLPDGTTTAYTGLNGGGGFEFVAPQRKLQIVSTGIAYIGLIPIPC